MKKMKKVFLPLSYFIAVYWKELVFMCMLTLAFIFDLKYSQCLTDYSTNVADIILVLLPLVFTVLPITLFLPREKYIVLKILVLENLEGKTCIISTE